MADETQQVRQTTVQDGNTTETTKSVIDPEHKTEHHQNVAARVIWFIAGVMLVMLGFRFLFALLGANPGNGFADFLFDVTRPLVSPFINLFRYDDYTVGVSTFEVYTLVAMLFYSLVAYGIARLVTINRD